MKCIYNRFFLMPLLIYTILGYSGCLYVTAQAVKKPHIGYLYPAGAAAGTTVTVRIGGQHLEGAFNVMITGIEASSEINSYNIKFDQRKFRNLQTSVEAIEGKLINAEGMEKERYQKALARVHELISYAMEEPQDEELKKYYRQFLMKEQPNEQIAEVISTVIALPAGLIPGTCEIRLQTPLGFSNPMIFCISDTVEIMESEPNDLPGKETPVSPLPAVLNGQILPGEIDRFRFFAEAGSAVVIKLEGRALIPYLADAVPGWFQPVVTVYNEKGEEIAYADDYNRNPDPLFSFVPPVSAPYILEVRDSIFRGRDDFIYRVTVGPIPYITSVYPLGGSVKTDITLELSGFNLPFSTYTLNAPHTEQSTRKKRQETIYALAGNDYTLSYIRLPYSKKPNPKQPWLTGYSAPLSFNLSSGNEILLGPAQTNTRVTLPCTINGRFLTSRAQHHYSFIVKKNEIFAAEVTAHRLGSPADTAIFITDPSRAVIARSDDVRDESCGLITHHADPQITLTAVKDGIHTLTIFEVQDKFGSNQSYRLRIGPPEPDFSVRIAPSVVYLPAMGSTCVTAHIIRRNGYSGPVSLSLTGEEISDVTLSGSVISSARALFTLTAPADPKKKNKGKFYTAALHASAHIEGTEIIHPVVPAEDMMQAFLWRHLVPAKNFIICIENRNRAQLSLVKQGTLTLFPGAEARIQFNAVIDGRKQAAIPPQTRISVEPFEDIQGITVGSVEIPSAQKPGQITILSDPEKAKPGTSGNIVLNFYVLTTNPRNNAEIKSFIAMLPAVPYRIEAKTP